MKKRASSRQDVKHEKMEQEFRRTRLSLAEIAKSDSVSLEAYQLLQELLVMLRERRKKAGLSLDAVSEASGIDKAYLSRLENGKVINPTFETLYRYAAAIRPIASMRDLVPA
jgi:DNA-binding Xre family transcriptional regulator